MTRSVAVVAYHGRRAYVPVLRLPDGEVVVSVVGALDETGGRALLAIAAAGRRIAREPGDLDAALEEHCPDPACLGHTLVRLTDGERDVLRLALERRTAPRVD